MSIPSSFRCYLVTKDDDGRIVGRVTSRPMAALPVGDVLIRVAYSSLNYKDAMAATGHPGVVCHFPHVPGIDAAGTVVESSSGNHRIGDEVLVTGFGLGADRWGGFAELIRVPADSIIPIPEGLSLRESMIFGTAGLTAALSVLALTEHQIEPASGEIVVTGASGGVGSIAIAILAKCGYCVTAVSGKPSAHDYLRELGARRVIGRSEVDDRTSAALLKSRWAGAIDTVGGNTLATLLRATARGGCVAACGLVGGKDLSLTVFPFILRGVNLIGIDSDQCPLDRRLAAWKHLATDWRPSSLDAVATEIELEQLEH